MKAIEEAFKIIDNPQNDAFYTGGWGNDVIQNAEKEIGLTFPENYKVFIRKYGLVLIAGMEFSGIGKSIKLEDWARDTLFIRTAFKAPKEYLVFSDTGDGAYYALDTKRMKDGECPVVLLDDVHGQKPVDVAPDFGTFLLEALQRVVSQ